MAPTRNARPARNSPTPIAKIASIGIPVFANSPPTPGCRVVPCGAVAVGPGPPPTVADSDGPRVVLVLLDGVGPDEVDPDGAGGLDDELGAGLLDGLDTGAELDALWLCDLEGCGDGAQLHGSPGRGVHEPFGVAGLYTHDHLGQSAPGFRRHSYVPPLRALPLAPTWSHAACGVT